MIEVEAPVTSINEANVYSVDATAIAVLTGIYTDMINSSIFSGNSSITLFAGLGSDELTLHNSVTASTHIAYYTNSLKVESPSQTLGAESWNLFYNIIFKCNAAIEGITKSTTLTFSVKQQLLGEAKFVRAFIYFYLVNLFGDVPLAIATDPTRNATLSRAPQSQIYEKIIDDLKEASNLLSPEYLNGNLQPYSGSKERLRPTKWAAASLLARVYMYTNNYSMAEIEATKVIDNSSLYSLVNLNDVFLKNSTEAIWQLQPVLDPSRNTEEAFTYVIPTTGPSDINGPSGNPVYLSNILLSKFDLDDQRRANGNWIDSIIVAGFVYYYPHKYKVTNTSTEVTEYLMVLRLAEQYLIRAEVRAHENKISEAQSDLNAIRTRAGLSNTTANDRNSLIQAILDERQKELFVEWGHRWLDLKRTNIIDSVMSVVCLKKGGVWNSFQQWYPIPLSDILKDPNLVQNSGY